MEIRGFTWVLCSAGPDGIAGNTGVAENCHYCGELFSAHDEVSDEALSYLFGGYDQGTLRDLAEYVAAPLTEGAPAEAVIGRFEEAQKWARALLAMPPDESGL